MPVQTIIIDRLFGSLRHEVSLHEGGLTFLFGLNGSGKTTILQLIDALFNQRFNLMLRAPFGEMSVALVDGEMLSIKRTEDGVSGGAATLSFECGTDTWEYSRPRGVRSAAVNWIVHHHPHLRRVGARMWQDRRTGRQLSLDEVLSESDDIPTAVAGQTEAPEWLRLFVDRESTYFIRANRLHAGVGSVPPGIDAEVSEDGPPQTVEGFATALAKKINTALADYGEFSQARESSFPQRFLEQPRTESPDELHALVKERYAAQAVVRARYVQAGLLEPGEDFALPETFNLEKFQFLAAYLADVDAKLDQLAELATKLELFLDIVNTKLRRKQIVVDRHVGFRVDGSGPSISLSSLSSGEQQEIVLTYGLIFHEHPGTLVLIDEPELSLHVGWQFQLVPDFERIAKLAGLRFLIATHSPQAVNGRNDITIYLRDEPGE